VQGGSRCQDQCSDKLVPQTPQIDELSLILALGYPIPKKLLAERL
jgi:hypothetical protein